MMYRTTITIDPYAISSGWVCPVCEQQKTALAGGYRNESRWAALKKED
nr:MAG TPA: rubredoxin iron binding domains containing a [Caudoviricetes sp.]